MPGVEGGRAYRLAGQLVDPTTRAGQAALEAAHRAHTRPRCFCVAEDVLMYIAHVGGRFVVKRMPGSGPVHAVTCASHAPADPAAPRRRAGRRRLVRPGDRRTCLRLGFGLSVGDRGGGGPQRGAGVGDVPGSPARLGLRALLDYLWDESDLVSWSPGMAGARGWPVLSWRLRQVAADTQVAGHCLLDRLYLPEPFRLDRKAAIAARRAAAWRAATTPPGAARQLMLLIAEVKAIGPARYGHKLTLKHLPDAPLFLDEHLHRWASERFAREIDMWHAHERGHLVVIATVAVGRGGSATARELALMPTTQWWHPYDNPRARALLDAAVAQRRRFRVAVRGARTAATAPPVLVLTDTRLSTPLFLSDDNPHPGTPPTMARHAPIAGSGPGTRPRRCRGCPCPDPARGLPDQRQVPPRPRGGVHRGGESADAPPGLRVAG